MNDGGKVVINLATGLEDAERVTVAFPVANAAAGAGKRVTMFLTMEAVRIASQATPRGSPATAARRSRRWPRTTRRREARCSSARSASRPAS
jgi:peroxiredoxin family protein